LTIDKRQGKIANIDRDELVIELAVNFFSPSSQDINARPSELPGCGGNEVILIINVLLNDRL
jgi:hypothetical protein